MYIDQLFIEPAVSTDKEYLQPPSKAAGASNHVYKKETCPSASNAEEHEVVGSQETIGGMNKGKGKQLTVKEYLQPPLKAAAASNHLYKKEICPSTSSAEEPEEVGSQETIGGMNKGKGKKLSEAMHSADDMWESLVLASPQMYGINERAEEFINKFRAEMMLQERLARRL